ncbi:hypothetical protein M406DRAFT_74910 [Cryphonectria parasitica EP155]|uniref:Uncharacterized protein n=1 Tax=Cryphonectria parasitica (strain ATCC 38755 / EP155) TaxID=660469 RepID=A0A9P4XVD9_CRYP1|nr:uncharacterized protein M406DRAFT_74910 [Cryphonectria parasitica EP155]KAF3761992.1 hypothetical protein M406DRAFT_74910 [Cryphonectria parasitica EP155]
MESSPFLSQQNVKTGLWWDFNSNQWKLLLEEHWASILTTTLGVVLAISGPYLFKIGLFLIINAARFIDWASQVRRRTKQDPESQSLLRHKQQPSARDFLEQTKDVGGVREFFQPLRKASRQTSGYHFVPLILVYIILVALWIGRVIGGVFAAKVMTDGVALWYSPRCGVWEFDSDNSGDGAASRHDVFDRGKESRAGDYAKSCYSPPHAFQSMFCNFFYQPNISFSTSSWTYECPFKDRNLCMKGTQAVTFDTGLVDASLLGINAPPEETYKFRRSSTCTPLSIGSPYVRSKDVNGSTVFDYYYGQIHDGENVKESTFSSTGNPFNIRLPAYNVEAYTWDPAKSPTSNYWTPLEGLRSNTMEGYSLTIMFISSLRILFVKPSTDPIFPTDNDIDIDGSLWYYKSDPRYRVLVCSDSYEFRSPDGQKRWSRDNRISGLPPAYWLMDLALNASNTYDSIAKRLGSALIAQEKVSQFTSAALPENHWVDEAKLLFETSLARIQFDAWSIASGEDALHVGADGYIEKTPREAGNLCGLFKFRSYSHRNVDFLAFFLTILLVPVPSWMLSWPKTFRWSWASSSSEQREDQAGYGTSDGAPIPEAPHQGSGNLTAPGHRHAHLAINQNATETLSTGPRDEQIDESPSEPPGEPDEDLRSSGASSASDLVAIPGAAPEARSDDGIGSDGNQESDKGKTEEYENIILFWLIWEGLSILCWLTPRLMSILATLLSWMSWHIIRAWGWARSKFPG